MSTTKITAALVLMAMALMLGMAGDYDLDKITGAVVQTGRMIYDGVTR
jgi:tetrahydromethanopterin S-methyltransferase subunit C